MLKILFAILLSINSPSVTTNKNTSVLNITNETSVYICTGSYSTKYHYNKNCRGLSNCKSDIIKTSLSKAKNQYKRTLCGWED